jgi:mannose-1-phosphate guanylyltransferase
MTSNKKSSVLPVIMAGGSGSRLWPLSRELHPKQFLTLAGQTESMLQATVSRLNGLTDTLPLIITNEAHRFIAAEQMRQLGKLHQNILLEPIARNTAPAITLAALQASRDNCDPLLLVLAADHIIQNTPAFHAAVRLAEPLAESGKLVTFGIVASKAETGYGYIKRGACISDGAYEVAAFIEKPDKRKAEHYIASGEYDWNSGMFMFRASFFLQELEKHHPDILTACRDALMQTQNDLDFIRINTASFEACPSESIDYAVMEKTAHAVVVPLDAGWSDVGAFSSLWDVSRKDKNGNAVSGNVITHDSENCLIQAENSLVATIGLKDIVVIQTKDAVLVASRDRVQEVKKIVEQLKAEGRNEYKLHRQVYRPWGHYDSIDAGDRYQVKRISVNAGGKLSVQMHHHRAEHWVVVSGTARVTLNGKTQLLAENESIYLPIGAVHALENPGKIPLELIEIQVGAYLGEDDIVRIEDRYGRAETTTTE